MYWEPAGSPRSTLSTLSSHQWLDISMHPTQYMIQVGTSSTATLQSKVTCANEKLSWMLTDDHGDDHMFIDMPARVATQLPMMACMAPMLAPLTAEPHCTPQAMAESPPPYEYEACKCVLCECMCLTLLTLVCIHNIMSHTTEDNVHGLWQDIKATWHCMESWGNNILTWEKATPFVRSGCWWIHSLWQNVQHLASNSPSHLPLAVRTKLGATTITRMIRGPPYKHLQAVLGAYQ